MSEWLKEHAWKACIRGNLYREFESLTLRHFYILFQVGPQCLHRRDEFRGLEFLGLQYRQPQFECGQFHVAPVEFLPAKRAAASITDDVQSEMKAVLDLQRFYIESEKEPGENSDQVKNLDSRFHELLYNSCGSRPYADTLISLHKKIIKYRKASVTHHSRAVHALEEHTAIYEALAAHDGDRAAEASLRHVENARANLADIIQKEG